MNLEPGFAKTYNYSATPFPWWGSLKFIRKPYGKPKVKIVFPGGWLAVIVGIRVNFQIKIPEQLIG